MRDASHSTHILQQPVCGEIFDSTCKWSFVGPYWSLWHPQKQIRHLIAPGPLWRHTPLRNCHTCHIYERLGLCCSSQSSYRLHTVTPVALSFVRVRQSLTKRQSEGVEKPPKWGGVKEWGVTLGKHIQSYMSGCLVSTTPLPKQVEKQQTKCNLVDQRDKVASFYCSKNLTAQISSLSLHQSQVCIDQLHQNIQSER